MSTMIVSGMTEMKELLFDYILRQADNCLILGQRLSEWCGHGPVLEQDIALTNIALDLIGQSRTLYQYAAQVEGKKKNEDNLAFQRDAWDFRNVLLVEQPNGNFAYTIARQFYFDVFHYYFANAMRASKDEQLAAIAEKSLKEITYHLRYSSEWVIRLGDGTEESHQKMQEAIDDLWSFTGELTTMDQVDERMIKEEVGIDFDQIKPNYYEKIADILEKATLILPKETWMQKGGKQGQHSEHLGFILAEMQFLQRAYPNLDW